MERTTWWGVPGGSFDDPQRWRTRICSMAAKFFAAELRLGIFPRQSVISNY